MLKKNEIERIEKETIERYNLRLDKFGISPKTLGWDSISSQRTRFLTAVLNQNFEHRSILDIGCGFGDYLDFLTQCKSRFQSYRGIDINSRLIEEASKKFPSTNFETRNILLNNWHSRQADICVSFGLLNFKLDDNLTYTKQFLDEAWSITRECLIIDFLSTHMTSFYKEEDFVYYHNPSDILDMCLRLTDDVRLIHDYKPIPQREFMVFLRRRDDRRFSCSCGD